jgi:DNA-binding SARP family transcriptional activator
VLRHGRELAAEDWVYGKTRELLLYLLHVDSADKETIGAALWPDASERQLKHNFRTAIYHLRRALGDAEWITFQAGRYAFNRARQYWLDVEAFRDALAQAEREPARRAEHLQRAAELYRGDLALEALESEVLIVRREQLRQQAIDALIALGALRLEGGMLSAAADAYRRAIALDSYLEAAHRGLLRSLARQGERGAALAHYQALAGLLGRDLGIQPAPATRALAEAIAGGRLL